MQEKTVSDAAPRSGFKLKYVQYLSDRVIYFWVSQLAVLIKMLMVYLVYLCIGALAFSHMESDAETKRYRITVYCLLQ